MDIPIFCSFVTILSVTKLFLTCHTLIQALMHIYHGFAFNRRIVPCDFGIRMNWCNRFAYTVPFRFVCLEISEYFFFLVGILRRFGKLGYFIFAFFARFQVMMKLFSPSGAFLMRFFLRVSFIFVFFLFLLVAAARLLTRSTQLFSFTLCIGWYGIFVFGFPSYYVPCFCLCWSFFRYFFALLAPFWRNFKLCWFFYLN